MAVKPCPFSRPAPLTPAMATAAHEGRKTQTRREIHLPVVRWLLEDPGVVAFCQEFDQDCKTTPEVIAFMATHRLVATPRERRLLWARETHWLWGEWVASRIDENGRQRWTLDLAADLAPRFDAPAEVRKPGAGPGPGWAERVPMHMLRRHSRLTLEVEQVRVQRLQDITEEDARAEGCGQYTSQTKIHRAFNPDWKGLYKPAFMELWSSINGPESWDANPLVCAITFKVHHANIDALLIERGLKGAT